MCIFQTILRREYPMKARNSTLLKSSQDINTFGLRDLTADALTDEEVAKLNHAHEDTIQKLIAAEKKLDELDGLFSANNLFKFKRKKYADGAVEPYDGCISKNIYSDLTKKNQITDINIDITDVKKYPEFVPLLINVVFRDQKQAERFNNLFVTEKLDLTESGTHACGFTSYTALEKAFPKFIESKIISKANADILLADIRVFLEGRNLLRKSATLEAKSV